MAPRSEDPTLIIRVTNSELVQPICSAYVNVTDRQTDGRTDGRTTYDSNTALALRASRGNEQFWTKKTDVRYISRKDEQWKKIDIVSNSKGVLTHHRRVV